MFNPHRLRSIAITAIFFCLAQIAFAQTKVTVDGTVKDASGNPAVGAFILEKGTLNGTSADNAGKFSLTVPANATISVECIGFTTVEFKATKSETKNIVLADDALALDDVVVVGYSSTTKRDLISSVSMVKTDQLANLPVANIAQGLAGRAPGTIIVTSGGGINKTPSISIRGGGTPLYVIDGVIRPQSDFIALSSDDIEQMNILKDASATAIYGSRASNGIIQVVTKQGTKGKVSVDYDLSQSYQTYTYWDDPLEPWENYTYINKACANMGLEPDYTDEQIAEAKKLLASDGTKLQFNRDLFLKKYAPQTKHTVRINAGSDIARTYVSLSNTDQDSNLKTAAYNMNRTNVRLSESINLKKIGLQINATLDGYVQKQREPRSSIASGVDSMFSWFMDGAYSTYVNQWGHYTSSEMGKTLGDGAGYSKYNTNVMNAKGEAIWNIPWVKGLKVRASSNWRYYFYDYKQWSKDADVYDSLTDVKLASSQPSLSLGNSKNVGYTNQAFAEYANTFGKHSVQALAGYEQYYETSASTSLSRTNYEFDMDQISAGPASTQTNGASESELGRAAWIGQLRYNYANKYYLEGSIRYDGSDYFAEGKRWGAFIGGSLGWVVTGEKWMQPLVDRNILNMLKLRASYGQTGLDSSAGRFAYMQSYSLNSRSYVVDGEFASGFTEGSLPSPDLTWYTTTQTDLGLDFSSLQNRLYGSFDYFYYKTFGYLVSPTGQSYLNQVIGIGMPKVKSDSEYRREGIEIQLGWRDSIGDFTYDIAANLTYFDELWAYNQSESESSYMNPYKRDQQNKDYYDLLLHSLGYYQSADEVYNSVAYLSAINSGYLAAGDVRYEDSNGDGLIDSNDYRRLGKSSVPRSQFGLNINLGWKGIYLSALLQGSTNTNKYMGNTQRMQTWQRGVNLTAYEYQKDTWTPDNRDALYPRLMYNTNLNINNNFLSSDKWLLECSYVRVKDFQFGYDFKYSVLKNIDWLSRLKVGISGQNVFTLSNSLKYGIDPEANGASGYSYPVQKVWAFTLNIGF